MTMFCPLTGLRVKTLPEWSKKCVTADFEVNYFLIGDSIVYGRPVGKTDLAGVRGSWAINEAIAKHAALGTGPYVQIEDFAALTGSTQASRTYFTNRMNSAPRLSTLIFCNLSLPLSIAVTIGKRFNTTGKRVQLAADYGDAVRLALKHCNHPSPPANADALEPGLRLTRTGPSLTPVDVLNDDAWNSQAPGLTLRPVIVDQHILHISAEGNLTPEHLPLIDRMRHMCLSALPSGSNIDYIVVDARKLRGVSPLGRMKYMQMSRDWHRQLPLRMYILYGVNSFLRTAAQLARPIMPFKIRIAEDFTDAIERITEDGRAVVDSTTSPRKRRISLETRQADIEDLLAYIGSINWTKDGVDHGHDVGEQHPFFLLFESIRMIKEEFDSLFSERDRTLEELRDTNSDLQAAMAELEQAQEHVVQQERLAAVGHLSAGIAHDFNNILTSILGHAEILQMSPDTPPDLQAGLQHITTSGRQAESLVRQLLDFSRKSIRQPKVFPLESFIRESVRFYERTIPENVQFTLKLELGDYRIEADQTQMQQVITNLVVNARDAMPSGGTLTIGLSRLDAAGEVRCFSCDDPIVGEWLCLTVEDNGCGIPEDVLPHVFEPFYTTKGVGDGTGLGLSQVYGIVSQNGGHITVESQVGEGTSISLWLPRADGEEGQTEEDVRPAVQRGHGEAILIVEDEPEVLAVMQMMLERLGYQVKTAVDGESALALYRRHHGGIDLVLSDMVMPGMGGEELFRTLRAEDPGVRMVMMSGYPLRDNGAELLEQGVVAWLEKPIELEPLAQMVADVLSVGVEGSPDVLH